MKYAIIIPDGAADHPLDELDGRSPFEVARKPHTDRLSIEGRQGTVVTTPPDFPCGSDVCTMSLLGYDPAAYHTGRAPLEAAASGIDLGPDDWVFRVNLVTVVDGAMVDHSAGHIRSDEGRRLIEQFAAHRGDAIGRSGTDAASAEHEPAECVYYPGVSYRNLMVDRSGRHDWTQTKTVGPHDILGEPVEDHLPRGGPHADLLRDIFESSAAFLATHDINETRRDLGELPATHLWPWGQGRRPVIDSFRNRFGLSGAMITAVDLLGGLAALIEWPLLDVPGQTSYHDTDYAAAGRHAIDALRDYDLVCVHIEAPDEASHAGDAATKIASIEEIDRHVVGPVHLALRKMGPEHRILYLPDHYTSVGSRMHDPTPVPFAMVGHQVRTVLERPFNEANAGLSDLHIQYGHELMEYFLFGGLARPTTSA